MQKNGVKQNKAPHNWILLGLLVTFLALDVVYSISIPLGEGVDEVAHFDFVRYVKEKRALPVQPMDRDQGVEVWMGHHPPLYYVLGAAAISWTDTADFAERFRFNPHFVWRENDGENGWNVMMHFGQDQYPWQGAALSLQTMRFFNILLAMVAIYAIYRAVELMFVDQPWIALGATAVIAFNPSFIFMSIAVHHDVLQMTIFSLALWWIIRYLQKPIRGLDFVLAGLLVGAAMLTKLSGLALALVIGLAMVIKAVREEDWQGFSKQSVIVYGVAALVAAWWYIRNWLLYGDLMGWQMFLNIHGHMQRQSLYTWDTFTNEFLAQIGRTYWGGFGFMHITFPEITRYLWWLVGLALVGLLVLIVRRKSSFRKQWAEWSVLFAVLIILFISFVRFSIATTGAGHGRYLFPASLSIGIIVVVGLNGFTSFRHQRAISIALALGMLTYAILFPAALVFPKYAPPVTASEGELSQGIKTDLELAQGLTLVAYQLADERLIPGQEFPIRLFWKAQGDPQNREDPQVRLELVNDQGEAMSSFVTWPVPALSPDVWQTDTVYVTESSMVMDPDESFTRLFLTIAPSMAAEDSEGQQDRSTLTELVTAGSLIPVEASEAPQNRAEVFADQLGLYGYELFPESVVPDDTLLVELYWQVLNSPEANYTTFVHLLNDRGELVTQFDRLAGGESSPTSTWRKGQVLRDVYSLAIPEELPPGNYTLNMGMYTWPSLERLPVTVDGSTVGDVITLGEVQILR